MLWPAIFANCAVGSAVAFFFVIYYINGEAKGKLKAIIEMMFGTVANGGLFLFLDRYFQLDDVSVRLIALACCYFSFLFVTGILLLLFAFLIKGGDNNGDIRLRDIFLGQYAFIDRHYQRRSEEIDGRLNIANLEERENAVSARENSVTLRESNVANTERMLADEATRIEEVGKKKLRIKLPENSKVTLNQDYIATMPSYLEDFSTCVQHISLLTENLMEKIARSKDENRVNIENEKPFDVNEAIKSYLLAIATHISTDLFGANSSDARIHFRIYNRERNGYEKYLAVMGDNTNVLLKPMTFIPYEKTNMIARSYECRRALIKSLNTEHHFEGNNHRVWQEYLTYTFTDLLVDGKPFLSFGISIKNVERFRKHLHFINYFRLESFLQHNIERVHNEVNLAAIFYGGTT